MHYRPLTRFIALMIGAFAASALAQPAKPAPVDAVALLQAAKAASGGSAWDRFVSQHSRVKIYSAGRSGTAERWVDMRRGRSFLKFEVPALTGTQGFDGRLAWSQEGTGEPRSEVSTVGRELAVNAAYRDKLAFWFPDRGGAKVEFKEHTSIGVTGYDVVRITPEGGRPFEFWINGDTRLIDRMVEPEAVDTRTESYSDFREVQSVKVPFRVRAIRTDDPRTDEIVTVDLLEYNVPLDGIRFTPAGIPAADWRFPDGKNAVEVPFEVHNGHLYVRAKLDGKGPFLMLFDVGGVNVIVPDAARALGRSGGANAASTGPPAIDVETMDVGGLTLRNARFAVAAAQTSAQRAEGVAMDGLLGFELVKRFPTRIDYASSKITFYDPDRFRYEGKSAPLPLVLRGRVPEVEGSIDGVPGKFGLDVGATASVTLAGPYWRANKLDQKLGAKQELIADAGPGGPLRARVGRAENLKLGAADVKGPVTLLATATSGPYAQEGFAGNVGYGVLRRFAIVFDLPREQLYLEPNAALADADVFDRSGLWVEPAGKGLAIVEAVAGAPGAQAGLKAGDVIVAIDGESAAGMPLAKAREQLRAAPGTRVRVKLANGSERTLTLRELI